MRVTNYRFDYRNCRFMNVYISVQWTIVSEDHEHQLTVIFNIQLVSEFNEYYSIVQYMTKLYGHCPYGCLYECLIHIFT